MGFTTYSHQCHIWAEFEQQQHYTTREWVQSSNGTPFERLQSYTKTTSNSIQFSFAPLGISKALTEDGWISFRFGQESPSGSLLCKSVKRQLGGLPDQRFFGGVLIGIGIFWQMLAQIPWRQWSLSKPTVTNISCDFGLTNSCSKVDILHSVEKWIVLNRHSHTNSIK